MIKNTQDNPLRKSIFFFALMVLIATAPVFPNQTRKSPVSCKRAAFAALKPLPTLSYSCPTDAADEYDDRILKTPARIRALKDLMKELESFTNPDWWNSSANDLNACYVSGKPGPLSEADQEQFNSSEYQPPVMGNNRIRLVLVSDPCYQISYGGSNGFILYRKGPRVYVSQVLDGYYSRLEKSVFLRLFSSRAGESIKITTANIAGMQPEYSYHFFKIDKATNKAVEQKSVRR